jgi:carboxymethylenebutenolidase
MRDLSLVLVSRGTLAVVLALTAGCTQSSKSGSAGTSTTSTAPPPASAVVALPPGEANAKAVLESSPRHGEFVDVPLAGKTPIRTYVVYPERSDKAGVVIVIHEIFGLSDWIRSVADQLASDGFIAVAPDLISGMGPGGGGTDSVASRDDVVKLVRALTPAETRARLDATRAYAQSIAAGNGKIATIGFCWGGARSFEYAAATPPPAAAVVFYGTSPDSVTLPDVKAPVLGHYGGDDARVNATIDPAKAELAKLGRFYESHVYEGAGHGFLRQQDGREGANLEASQAAWPRTVAFLTQHLK